jgi:hypothetical protein
MRAVRAEKKPAVRLSAADSRAKRVDAISTAVEMMTAKQKPRLQSARDHSRGF